MGGATIQWLRDELKMIATAADSEPVARSVPDTGGAYLVPAMGTVTIAFDADNPGRWLYHCHNLYHMATGMMSFVTYENAI